MKYALFGMAALFGVPAMTWAAMSDRRLRQGLVALLILSTCFGTLGKINFISMESYRGPDRGFEITFTDLIAFSIALGLVAGFRNKILWLPPRSWIMILTFLLCVASAATSPVPLYGAFTVFKLLRMYMIYWCVVNVLEIGTPIAGLWAGVVSVATVMTVIGLKQKYLNGLYRIPGPFDHSNTIPLYVNLILALLLTWAVTDKSLKPWQVALSLFGTLGLLFCVVATASRAGMALAALSLVVALAACNFRGFNPRSLMVSGVIALLMIIGAAKATSSILNRIKTAPKSSEEAREEFNAAAKLMRTDHFFGVGLNNFSEVLTTETRYHRFLSVMKNETQAGVCHHIYNLTAAELGYPGLAIFLGLLLSLWWTALRYGVSGKELEASLLFGLMLGAAALHLQGTLEWGFRITPVMQMFVMTSAMIVGLARRLQRIRAAAKPLASVATAAPSRARGPVSVPA